MAGPTLVVVVVTPGASTTIGASTTGVSSMVGWTATSPPVSPNPPLVPVHPPADHTHTAPLQLQRPATQVAPANGAVPGFSGGAGGIGGRSRAPIATRLLRCCVCVRFVCLCFFVSWRWRLLLF